MLCSGLFWVLRVLNLILEWCSVKACCLFGLVLWYSFPIRLVLMFRKQDLNKRLFLVLVKFEFFLQKNKMWCETVKYSKKWNKLSKLNSLDHPGLGPPKGPTTSNCLKEVAFCWRSDKLYCRPWTYSVVISSCSWLPTGDGPYSKFPLYQ